MGIISILPEVFTLSLAFKIPENSIAEINCSFFGFKINHMKISGG